MQRGINEDWRKDRITSAHTGENPMVITKMRSGFAAIGDTQFLPGYCVLLPFKEYSSLEELDFKQRSEFLLDMSLIGEAIIKVCNARRVNYSIYGNTDAYLHAHVFPRYNWEPNERLPNPVWQYPVEKWSNSEYQYSDYEHREMRAKLTNTIHLLMEKAY
ncbi:HIT family protein [Rossellomorea vietnamensis]|uniref:HIT family protein n=1 Tax=Rossellomorea vietnamensis TaxID=218284 RepID=UPI00054CEC2F|nr:HIT family protein [Rossellomorea vietnamensis]